MSRSSALRPLGERDFRLLFLARTFTFFGAALAPLALAFAVLDLTGSATDLGLVTAAGLVPMLIFTLVGGVWADRLPRHHVMVASDAISGSLRNGQQRASGVSVPTCVGRFPVAPLLASNSNSKRR